MFILTSKNSNLFKTKQFQMYKINVMKIQVINYAPHRDYFKLLRTKPRHKRKLPNKVYDKEIIAISKFNNLTLSTSHQSTSLDHIFRS